MTPAPCSRAQRIWHHLHSPCVHDPLCFPTHGSKETLPSPCWRGTRSRTLPSEPHRLQQSAGPLGLPHDGRRYSGGLRLDLRWPPDSAFSPSHRRVLAQPWAPLGFVFICWCGQCLALEPMKRLQKELGTAQGCWVLDPPSSSRGRSWGFLGGPQETTLLQPSLPSNMRSPHPPAAWI